MSSTPSPALRVVPADVTLDSNMVGLVNALNAFPGVQTIGSCGGHVAPTGGQWEEGTFYVNVVFDDTEHGYFALEFLAWAINNDYRRAGYKVMLYPYAPPPYLNEPGNCLRFHLEGYGADPDELAVTLDQAREQLFVPPGAPAAE